MSIQAGAKMVPAFICPSPPADTAFHHVSRLHKNIILLSFRLCNDEQRLIFKFNSCGVTKGSLFYRHPLLYADMCFVCYTNYSM